MAFLGGLFSRTAYEDVLYDLIGGPRARRLHRSNEASIFVRNLESFADKTTLRVIFSEFGPILSLKVVRDESGNSKGYGFVNFLLRSSADAAVRQCNGRPFYGRNLVVQPRRDRPLHQIGIRPRAGNPSTDVKLYVKNLSNAYQTEDKLRALFAPFGDITYAKVVTDDSGKPKDFGYVSFADSKVAANASKILNGMDVGNGQQLLVRRAHTREDMSLLRSGASKITRVFVDGLEKSVDDRVLTETFEAFGCKVLSSRVCLNELGYSKGFGSVVLFSKSDAEEAFIRANGMHLRGQKISATLEKKDHRRAAPKGDAISDPTADRRVFVSNLSQPYGSEAVLKALFATAGEVTEVEVKVDSNGVPKGFAIITFGDQPMAEQAIKLFDRKWFGDKRLYVKKDLTKEELKLRHQKKNEIDCQICFDSIFKAKAVSFGCDHQFCSICVRKFLETRIDEGLLDNIKCPEPECQQKADQQLVQKSVSKPMFERFERLTLKKAVQDMEDVIYCPTPNCGALIEAEIQLLRAECRKCSLVYCTLCLKKYHELTDCGLSDEQKRQQDKLSESFVDKEYRKCPSCKSSIEKNGGCNHMTCKCGYQFCWLCDKPWALEHPGCALYSPGN